MSALLAFGAGLLFALGLGIGGMTDPRRVLGFLDVFGAWDPTLVFVMAGAVTTYAALRPLVMRRQRPVLEAAFAMPTKTVIDTPLLAGAALFGIGWGLVGYCPGPAITALGAGIPAAGIFVGAMLGGMLLHAWRTNGT